MKRRDAILALVAAALVVMALLAVFAIELSNTQAKSKRDVEARVQERGVLAGALIDSLFQTVGQQIPQDQKLYGARVVTNATMEANQSSSAGGGYTALLDSGGRVLAATRGFTAQARADLAHSSALALIRSGHPYGLGNVLPYGKTGVQNLAVIFPTQFGNRILLSGFTPNELGLLFAGELRQIPGVTGSYNTILDGNRRVLATTAPGLKVGSSLNTPLDINSLSHLSGDVNGRYYVQVPLANSTWRIVLSAPNGPLFASVTGLRKWVPWLIFAAFALVALAALALGRKTLRAADDLRKANERLGDANEALGQANVRLNSLNDELAVTNDTLERRAAELSRSNNELEQFASIASHDLQEPLRKVRTFTEQLTVIESDRLSDKGRDYLQRTNSAAARMQKLIEDLLKYSRVATHGRPFAAVDLDEVTRDVLEDLEAQVDHVGATVTVGELPTIYADPLQMRQLMQNLISNALKFHRNGVKPEVTIKSTVTNGKAAISVHDNGIGFDPQYARRIFRVFERLNGRSEFPGTGIGLALCRRIAERHGGTVVADSAEGQGSTFTVTLPVEGRDEVDAPMPSYDTEQQEDLHVPA